jgi:hypothetical protein
MSASITVPGRRSVGRPEFSAVDFVACDEQVDVAEGEKA